MAQAKDIVAAAQGVEMGDQELKLQTVELAEAILTEALGKRKLSERYQSWKLARMMDDPSGKALTLAMADQVFRPATHHRSAEQFRYLIDQYGVPSYLPLHEQLAMRLGAMASAWAPEIVMPAVTNKMRAEAKNVILPSEDAELKPHLAKRKRNGIRMNINQLGEAILGEEEAARRLTQVVERLESPDCEYISVKISAIFSQIHLVAYEETLEEIKQRLRVLYSTALKHPYRRKDGAEVAKFVNLDMEEYRDLHLTCDAFKAVLMEPEFMGLRAGIVLQAYLPDAFPVQKELTDWARERVAQGGEAIKVRIVKGANLAMEKVEASLHDWEQAPYHTKADVDANFKRMVRFGVRSENAECVRLGVASHNLFEIAYTLLLRASHQTEDWVEFEMLEGMANHQARAVRGIAEGLLFYAPVVCKEDFHSAISYLVRRLDENTAEENFLHDLFGMKPGCPLWHKQREMFELACDRQEVVSVLPNRSQHRGEESYQVDGELPFANAADTDWSLRHNASWIRELVAARKVSSAVSIPLQIGGEEVWEGDRAEGSDPSRPQEHVYTYRLADAEGVERALCCAAESQSAWSDRGLEQRREILLQVAKVVAEQRGESIATMVLDGGKSVVEADGEVSEAIDFARYYADALQDRAWFDGSAMEPLGVVVVTPPWNFPFAIPLGGILAALVAGNTVILKPAPETVLTAWVMVQQLWQAGIPREVLQFVPCPDNHIGKVMVTDARVGAVVLTGAYDTARMFRGWKPKMRLYAETSGKNALIITAAADPDQAVKDLVKSAFGHAGQKCSAASLAIVEAELYDSPAFRRQLRDAAASLKVAGTWDFAAVMTPVIRQPDNSLTQALTQLDEGEEWLLEPQCDDENTCLWSPGIKLGVKPDSWFRRTECFGPVLGVIRADHLEHAIAIQNQSEFGLTGGIHSLDSREVAYWRRSVQVGNAYINRSITGAIVCRQPFGGWKKSCFGPGGKAGGPNYVAQFGTWTTESLPDERGSLSEETAQLISQLQQVSGVETATLKAVAGSYCYWMQNEFSIEHDPVQLLGETNHFRYVPLTKVLFRFEGRDLQDLTFVLLASHVSGVPITISSPKVLPDWVKSIAEVRVESEAGLAKRMPEVSEEYESLRAPKASEGLYRAAAERDVQLIDWKVLQNGRLELLHFFKEQSISETVHRYGNVIPTPEQCLAGEGG